jgi:hypothetical protein
LIQAASSVAQDDENLEATIVAQQTQIAALQTAVASPDAGSDKALYEATTAEGFDQWRGTPDWRTLGGNLINDGSNYSDYNLWLAAPFAPDETANYAVEAEIQEIVGDDSYTGFGIVVRAADGGGYWAGEKCGEAAITEGANPFNYCDFRDSSSFTPDDQWHRYRVEVVDNTITLLIDDMVVAEMMSNRFLDGGKVGLFSLGSQITVRSFKVIAL